MAKEYALFRMVLSSDPDNKEMIKKIDATLKARGFENVYNAIREE